MLPCELINMGNGTTAIICGRGQRRHPCHYCGNAAGYQCDHPVFRDNKKGTCDTWMCQHCRNSIGPELDLCRAHFNAWRNNGNKFVLGGEVIR